ncbi:MAG: histidine ammonia-lyase [Fidelibacterota bacterium]
MVTLSISPKNITWEDLAPFLAGPGKVRLSPETRKAIRSSYSRLTRILASNKKIYGVTTGFGKLAQVTISPEDQQKLQLNLVRSHACGVGKPLDPGVTRVVMILKILTFTKGYSGVRPELVQLMVSVLNHDILPQIPRKGSVGASGDLAPLAHLALTLIGEGEVLFQERIIPAMLALKEAGLEPVVFGPKEGLSLVNGTQVSTALAVKALAEAKTLLKTADIAGAITTEASLSTREVFQPAVHKLKKHPGQLQAANNVWRLLQGSEIIRSHADCDRVQDPYCIRCLPQVHGASRALFSAARAMINGEINSISDNPLILKTGQVVNSGHFHAEVIAQALDTLAIAMAEIGAISERRIHFLMKGVEGLVPPFGAQIPGLESGFMLAHVTAAALASENKTLAHPASVDSLPTSGGQEDFVSMAPWAGRKCLRLIENVRLILAVEILAGASINSRFHGKFRSARGIATVTKFLKRQVAFAPDDQPLSKDIEKVAALIQQRKIIQLVSRQVTLE